MTTVQPVPFSTIAGTWGRDAEWRKPGSEWLRMMERFGFVMLKCGEPPRQFTWSCDVNGVRFYKRWTGTSDHNDWDTGGTNLFDYFVPPLFPDARISPVAVNLVSHSHGLQVVLKAAAKGLKINTLVSIAGPVRDDMMRDADAARANIRYWEQLFDPERDRTQIHGSWFDGSLKNVREHPLADRNTPMPFAGHSGVLNDPKYFGYWAGVLARVRARYQPPSAA